MRELAERLGIPDTTLCHWISTGLVKADLRRRGRGGSIIGLTGLMEVETVMACRRCGISLQSIRKAVEALRELSGQERPLARLTLVITGSDLLWFPDTELKGKRISTLQKPGQILLVFPISQRIEELAAELKQETTANVAERGDLALTR